MVRPAIRTASVAVVPKTAGCMETAFRYLVKADGLVIARTTYLVGLSSDSGF
jgi:hypothetical protein